MRYSRCLLRTGMSMLALLLSLPSVMQHETHAAFLSDLLNGGFVDSGDKRFFGFENYTQSGDLNILPTAIEVIPIQTMVLGNLEFGIRFQTASGWELTGAGKNYDMGLDFLVKRLDGLPFITDSTLEITGNHVGGGEAHLVEGVIDADTLDTLANKEVFINLGNNGLDKLIDHQIFAHPAATIKISKDFQLQTRFDNDNIFVSHFDQTFSQIPEPSSFVLMSIGGWGLLSTMRFRHREYF